MRIDHGTLVLAADGARMLVFRNEGDRKFMILGTVACEVAGGGPSHVRGEDRPGRAFASMGPRRSAYDEGDRERAAEERFTRAAAYRFEDFTSFDRSDIVVVAPPRTLGVLRRCWSPATARRVIAEVPRDVVHLDTDAIAAAIARHPAPPLRDIAE